LHLNENNAVLSEEDKAFALSEEGPALSKEGLAFVAEVEALADEVWVDGPVIIHAMSAPPEGALAKTARRVANAFFISALALCLLLTTMLVFTGFSGGLFGLRFFVEPTDAMAPAIPRGSLLITRNRRPEQINPGDIITYYALPNEPESRLTRIVEERTGSAGNYLFRTVRPGDAAPDSIVINATSILGVRLTSLRYAGFVISFLRIYAIALAVLAAALCVAAVLLRKWLNPGMFKLRFSRFKRKEPDDVQTLL